MAAGSPPRHTLRTVGQFAAGAGAMQSSGTCWESLYSIPTKRNGWEWVITPAQLPWQGGQLMQRPPRGCCRGAWLLRAPPPSPPQRPSAHLLAHRGKGTWLHTWCKCPPCTPPWLHRSRPVKDRHNRHRYTGCDTFCIPPMIYIPRPAPPFSSFRADGNTGGLSASQDPPTTKDGLHEQTYKGNPTQKPCAAPGMTGMTDASAMRRPRTPCTRRDVSTTAFPAPGSAPMEQLPTFALPLCTVSRM